MKASLLVYTVISYYIKLQMKSLSPPELIFSFTLVFAGFQSCSVLSPANFAALLASVPAGSLILPLFAESATPLKK